MWISNGIILQEPSRDKEFNSKRKVLKIRYENKKGLSKIDSPFPAIGKI